MINPVITMVARPLRARLLRIGEPLPSNLNIEFPSIDPTWTWVVEEAGIITAALIACPGPGIAILLKICSSPLASSKVSLKLLRKSIIDMYNRGYMAYMVCLDISRPLEAKLARIAIKAGGLKMGQGIIIAGPTNIKGY